jgi:hypothetical protein
MADEKRTHHYWSKAWDDWRSPLNPATRGNVDYQGGAAARITSLLAAFLDASLTSKPNKDKKGKDTRWITHTGNVIQHAALMYSCFNKGKQLEPWYLETTLEALDEMEPDAKIQFDKFKDSIFDEFNGSLKPYPTEVHLDALDFYIVLS